MDLSEQFSLAVSLRVEARRLGSFYVIVRSAARALIGLQFVVMTLVAERPPLRATEAGTTFATPTFVHLSISARLCSRQRFCALHGERSTFPALWGLMGFAGVACAAIVARRMRGQAVYKLEFEDWLSHVALPLAAHATLTLSAFAALSYAREALFGVGAATLMLLFIGIHNAWDSDAYHVRSRDAGERSGLGVIDDQGARAAPENTGWAPFHPEPTCRST